MPSLLQEQFVAEAGPEEKEKKSASSSRRRLEVVEEVGGIGESALEEIQGCLQFNVPNHPWVHSDALPGGGGGGGCYVCGLRGESEH